MSNRGSGVGLRGPPQPFGRNQLQCGNFSAAKCCGQWPQGPPKCPPHPPPTNEPRPIKCADRPKPSPAEVCLMCPLPGNTPSPGNVVRPQAAAPPSTRTDRQIPTRPVAPVGCDASARGRMQGANTRGSHKGRWFRAVVGGHSKGKVWGRAVPQVAPMPTRALLVIPPASCCE